MEIEFIMYCRRKASYSKIVVNIGCDILNVDMGRLRREFCMISFSFCCPYR